MALLSKDKREKRLKFLGYGEYNKANILKFQKDAFTDKTQHDGIYGKNTDNALRHIYNVRKVTKNFKPTEFRCPCKRCTGYPNFMKQVELKHLQKIRDHYGKPMTVTSALRCSYENSRVGGVANSGHLTGYACDFYMPGVTDTVANRMKSLEWIKQQPNHEFTYGANMRDSNNLFRTAAGMGNAMHTETHKPEKKKTVSPFYNKTTILGQASCNEKGSLQGGKAGDQKKEVALSGWYDGGWIYVFRAKEKAVRERLAQAMIDACNNQHIGYDTKKPDRYTAWDLAEKNGHNIKGINVACETTCSQLVSMCMRAAGISKLYAQRHYDITTMTRVMLKCPFFKIYKERSYTHSPSNLLPGDILLSSHHTAMIVKSPNAK